MFFVDIYIIYDYAILYLSNSYIFEHICTYVHIFVELHDICCILVAESVCCLCG